LKDVRFASPWLQMHSFVCARTAAAHAAVMVGFVAAWDYNNSNRSGPLFWDEGGYSLCGQDGTRQSPVDVLASYVFEDDSLPHFNAMSSYDYMSGFTVENTGHYVEVRPRVGPPHARRSWRRTREVRPSRGAARPSASFSSTSTPRRNTSSTTRSTPPPSAADAAASRLKCTSSTRPKRRRGSSSSPSSLRTAPLTPSSRLCCPPAPQTQVGPSAMSSPRLCAHLRPDAAGTGATTRTAAR
jgi:hypothetical protein